jgi:hypothetical protein
MNEPYERAESLQPAETRLSLSHLVQTIHAYRAAIILTTIVAALATLVGATVLYLLAPGQVVTTQRFRLAFEGAAEGKFPNQSRFGTADITSGPILRRVYDQNQLAQFVDYGVFSRSVYILAANRELESLEAEFHARLSDPKLSPIDRDRIQQEFEMKKRSITNNEYAINYGRSLGVRSIPEPIVRKALRDILDTWADFAVNQQHVLEYQIAVLSPSVVANDGYDRGNIIETLQILRSRARRVLSNIVLMAGLPGGQQVRSPKDSISLEELRIRVEELVRFRLEPLVITASASGLIDNRPLAVAFMEDQLAYDQRELNAQKRNADVRREALAVYEQRQSEPPPVKAQETKNAAAPPAGEAVMPQLSDSFLERLVALSGRSADVVYRQHLVDEYKKAATDLVPLQQAVEYDQQVLQAVRGGGPASVANRADVQAQIEAVRSELSTRIRQMNDLYLAISHNMTPSTQLFGATDPPSSRSMHAIDLTRLALYSLMLVVLAFSGAVILSLLHRRVVEEEEEKAEEERTGP